MAKHETGGHKKWPKSYLPHHYKSWLVWLKEVCRLEEASEIDIKVARMEEGAKLALEADGQGYHVLVSRGVTDWIIRELADTIEEGALHF